MRRQMTNMAELTIVTPVGMTSETPTMTPGHGPMKKAVKTSRTMSIIDADMAAVEGDMDIADHTEDRDRIAEDDLILGVDILHEEGDSEEDRIPEEDHHLIDGEDAEHTMLTMAMATRIVGKKETTETGTAKKASIKNTMMMTITTAEKPRVVQDILHLR